MNQTASTRWCPTAEQLILLEEMYRSGIRNPNASQIRKITAHLSSFGKIEGKNVFYWFQNHKARDKHKLSRRLSRQHHLFLDYYYHFYNLKEASQFPTSQPYQYQQTSAPHRFFNQDGIGNYVTHGKNLPCNIEKCSASTPIYASYAEYIKSSYDAHPCYKPLKTLDLFPTTSTGLKDECRT